MSRHVTCRRGCTHWGPHGAAGLLIRHTGPDGPRYLLQRRAPWVHHGGTWSTPGGALHPGENPRSAALREASEELGQLPDLAHSHTVTNDHGGWAYHTVIVDTGQQFTPGGGDGEGTAHRWATAADMQRLDLHPDFAAALPDLIPTPKDRPVPAHLTGWRWWQLTPAGYLTGWHTPYARQPWPGHTNVTAVCNHNRGDHGPDDAPWHDCECGLRIMPDLADLLDGIRHRPARTGITPQVWQVIGGHDYHRTRQQAGVLAVPDVIGQVVVSGTVEAPCPWDDPPGTLRAQRARVGDQLYVSSHLARLAPMVARRYPRAQVHVGQAPGLPWLDEIQRAHAPVAA